MSQASFDAYNSFLMDGEIDRFTKILSRYELFKHVVDKPGDIVECGVFKGQGVMYWARLLQIFAPLTQRKVIGFDTFDGVPDTVTRKQDRDGSESFRDYGGVPAEIAAKAQSLGLAERIDIVPGDATTTIPDYAAARPGFRIALLNLDFDVYEPTLAALEALYDRVIGGGLIVFDEYAVHSWGESDAADQFLKDRGVALQSLPWALSPTAFIEKPL